MFYADRLEKEVSKLEHIMLLALKNSNLQPSVKVM
uniref:Uncharacterized protein n=1 Tax=Anguilla anguilla TaxID=7936 RepID=A0A0E9VVB8_ANGAN